MGLIEGAWCFDGEKEVVYAVPNEREPLTIRVSALDLRYTCPVCQAMGFNRYLEFGAIEGPACNVNLYWKGATK